MVIKEDNKQIEVPMKKITCNNCKACPDENGHIKCQLGYRVISKQRKNSFDGRLMDNYFPDEDYCPKPTTNNYSKCYDCSGYQPRKECYVKPFKKNSGEKCQLQN